MARQRQTHTHTHKETGTQTEAHAEKDRQRQTQQRRLAIIAQEIVSLASFPFLYYQEVTSNQVLHYDRNHLA